MVSWFEAERISFHGAHIDIIWRQLSMAKNFCMNNDGIIHGTYILCSSLEAREQV